MLQGKVYVHVCVYGCVHIVHLYVHVSVTFLNPTFGVIY